MNSTAAYIRALRVLREVVNYLAPVALLLPLLGYLSNQPAVVLLLPLLPRSRSLYFVYVPRVSTAISFSLLQRLDLLLEDSLLPNLAYFD